MTTTTNESILDVRNLRIEFEIDGCWTPTVDDVSFAVSPGQTLGLVGESGSGKSVTAMSLLGFTGRSKGQRSSGIANFRSRNLLGLTERELQAIRGNEIAMIPQEPMTSLDPAFKVGDQIAAGVRHHQKVSRSEAKRIAIEAMDQVRIPNAAARADSYPHEFSGGMRQRVLIAMAISNKPSLLIADEPTTALDVSVQAQILKLLGEMQDELGLAMVFITHNMGVVADICDQVAVMYAGQIAEQGDVYETFRSSLHPYTNRLLASMPSLEARQGRLESIPGTPPRPTDFPTGCRFAPRCPHALDMCTAPTTLASFGDDRMNRCSRGIDWRKELSA